MGRRSTTSTKIHTELKAKMEMLESKPSKVLQKATEDEEKRRQAQELKRELDRLRTILSGVCAEGVVKGVSGAETAGKVPLRQVSNVQSHQRKRNRSTAQTKNKEWRGVKT